MCHSPSSMQSAQIEKFVEQGMPKKIVKTLQYTLKKRAEEQYKKEIESQVTFHDTDTDTASTLSSSSRIFTSSQTQNSSTTATEMQTILSNEKFNEITEITPKSSSMLKIPKLCGRLRQLPQGTTNLAENTISNISETDDRNVTAIRSSSKDIIKNEKVYVDTLAIVTQLTKQFVQRLNNHFEKVQASKTYTLLTKTTQPAHVIAICILSFVLLTVWPDIIVGAHNGYGDDVADQKTNIGTGRRSNNNTLAVIAYLGAFATHFGAQIWMTFVSGLSLYFSLPRHTFGQCQQILFPKYFALNAVLSIGMLILFVKYFLRSWNVSGLVQLGALSVTAIIEVIVRLYLAPPMLRLMHEKYRIEDAIGSGQEVGSLVQGDLVQCPHYQRIHKAFRRIHMTVAMGNMTVLLATCLHLYFLASKIQIS